MSSNSPKKTIERIRSSKKELVRSFLGEYEDNKSPLDIIWPLALLMPNEKIPMFEQLEK